MPKLKINGKKIEVDQGTTILEAAASHGIEIPHFCYHPALSRPANCRMCLVECAAPRGGKLVAFPKLQPSCYTQVAEGMEVQTESDQVVRARKAVLEFILLNHPVDCPICDQAGECKLQDFYFHYSAQESRLKTRKVHKVKVFPIGPEVVYDGERCILCTRCVRFCDEITGTAELTTVQRADLTEIRTFPGLELDNDYSLCTVDLCPVGALTDRDFRFKCRVWYLETTDSVCTGCARGCNIHLEHFKGETQRYRPRPNHDVNQWWMCDHGRRTYRTLHDNRLLSPRIEGDEVPMTRAIAEAVSSLRRFIKTQGVDELAVVLSPHMPTEDLAALIHLTTGLGVTRFYAAGKPDDAFTLRREPSKTHDDFLIVEDKNPNFTGLVALAAAAGIEVRSAVDLFNDLAEDAFTGLYLTSSDFPYEREHQEHFERALGELELLIYQAAHDKGLASLATVALPAATHAERSGSFVNVDGIQQPFDQAYEPHGLAQPDFTYAIKLSKRLGVGWPYESFDELAAGAAEHIQTALAMDDPDDDNVTESAPA